MSRDLVEFARSMSNSVPPPPPRPVIPRKRVGRPPGGQPARIDWKDPLQRREYKAAAARQRHAELIKAQIAAGVKVCNGCKTEKPFSEFEPDPRKRLGVGGRCKACKNSARLARYYDPAKIEHERERSRTATGEIRDKAIAIYGGQCEKCGNTRDLEFDHVDGNGGEHRQIESAAAMKWRVASTGRRLDDWELRLLCRDCHRGLGASWTRQSLMFKVAAANNWPVVL